MWCQEGANQSNSESKIDKISFISTGDLGEDTDWGAPLLLQPDQMLIFIFPIKYLRFLHQFLF